MSKPSDLVGSLTSLIKRWRGQSKSGIFHDAAGASLQICADELEALLRSFPHQQKEEDFASPSVSGEPPYVSGCNNCGGVNGAHLPGCEYVALLERRAVSGELTFQRFEPAQIYGDAEMRPSEDGDWVRLTDVEPLLQLVAHHCELAAMLVRPPVVMCACEHWLTCEHPWPSFAIAGLGCWRVGEEQP